MNETPRPSRSLHDRTASAAPRLGAPLATRTAVFAYGLFAYAVFFASLLVSFGFVANIAVPGLDRPRQSDAGLGLAASAAVDLLLLSLFAVQHSVMARPWFKNRFTRLVPVPAERATYVLLSSIALLLLVAFWQPLGGVVWDAQGTAARVALTGLMAGGWLLVLAATFMINHFDLFGLRQVWLFLLDRPYTHLPFKTPGLYSRVRHPLYVGWLVAFWAAPTMSGAHLLFALVTTAYILAAIRWEERDLIAAHGSTYAQYRERVPKLLPRLRRSPHKEAA